MARKLVVRSENDEVWVINLKAKKIKELKGGERKRMLTSLSKVRPTVGVQNAVLGDDLTEVEAATGHEKIKF